MEFNVVGNKANNLAFFPNGQKNNLRRWKGMLGSLDCELRFSFTATPLNDWNCQVLIKVKYNLIF